MATHAGNSGRLVYSDQHHCIGVVDGCIVTYSRQPPDAKYFAAWNLEMARLSEAHPGAVCVVTIIDSSSPSPDEPTRKLIRSVMQRHARAIARCAHVVEGTGFGAAAIRSAISLTSLAARAPFKQKVFATIEQAGEWLAGASSPSSPAVRAAVLSSLVQEMRTALAA